MQNTEAVEFTITVNHPFTVHQWCFTVSPQTIPVTVSHRVPSPQPWQPEPGFVEIPSSQVSSGQTVLSSHCLQHLSMARDQVLASACKWLYGCTVAPCRCRKTMQKRKMEKVQISYSVLINDSFEKNRMDGIYHHYQPLTNWTRIWSGKFQYQMEHAAAISRLTASDSQFVPRGASLWLIMPHVFNYEKKEFEQVHYNKVQWKCNVYHATWVCLLFLRFLLLWVWLQVLQVCSIGGTLQFQGSCFDWSCWCAPVQVPQRPSSTLGLQSKMWRCVK